MLIDYQTGHPSIKMVQGFLKLLNKNIYMDQTLHNRTKFTEGHILKKKTHCLAVNFTKVYSI